MPREIKTTAPMTWAEPMPKKKTFHTKKKQFHWLEVQRNLLEVKTRTITQDS
jgi:hypothetical protein